jgi:serine/threonine kinase 32
MKTLSKAVILERNHVGMVMKERNLLARLHCFTEDHEVLTSRGFMSLDALLACEEPELFVASFDVNTASIV